MSQLQCPKCGDHRITTMQTTIDPLTDEKYTFSEGKDWLLYLVVLGSTAVMVKGLPFLAKSVWDWLRGLMRWSWFGGPRQVGWQLVGVDILLLPWLFLSMCLIGVVLVLMTVGLTKDLVHYARGVKTTKWRYECGYCGHIWSRREDDTTDCESIDLSSATC